MVHQRTISIWLGCPIAVRVFVLGALANSANGATRKQRGRGDRRFDFIWPALAASANTSGGESNLACCELPVGRRSDSRQPDSYLFVGRPPLASPFCVSDPLFPGGNSL